MTAVERPPEAFRDTEIGNLPMSWSLARLGDLFDVQQGKALSPSARRGVAPRPFLRTANVLWGRLDLGNVDEMDFAEEEAQRLSLRPGDLLVCEGGEIGRTAIWRGEIEACSHQNHLHRLRRRRADCLPEFVMYWMQAAFLQLGLYGGVGNRTTIPNLSGARLKELQVPLPALAEQQGIAGSLAKIQSAVEVQAKIVRALEELKAATMAKLFREGLRGEPLKQTEIGEIPESWELASCDALCEQVSVGIVVTPAKYYVSSGVPCFRSFNIQGDRLLEKDLVFISDRANELHGKSKLRAGDVVVVRTGYPGTACVIPERYDGANCVDLLFARPKHDLVLSDYLARYINSPAGRRQVLFAQGGLAQQHFNVSALKRMVIALPPKEEQADIARSGQMLDHGVTVAERKLTTLRSKFSSMLQQLMTGQLRVPTTAWVGAQAVLVQSGQSEESIAQTTPLPGVERFVAELVRRFEPERVILFGRHAEGSPRAEGKVGLLVVMDFEGRALAEAVRIEREIAHDFALEVMVRRPEEVRRALESENPLIKRIVEGGNVLYARPDAAASVAADVGLREQARRATLKGKLSDETLREIVRRVVEAVAPEKIILFGSAARGEMGPDSDVDLLVVKSGVDRLETAQAVRRSLLGIGMPKDVIAVTPEDLSRYGGDRSRVIFSALREGKIVYAA